MFKGGDLNGLGSQKGLIDLGLDGLFLFGLFSLGVSLFYLYIGGLKL